MLVGQPFSMKTSAIRVLAAALGDMCAAGQGEHKVRQKAKRQPCKRPFRPLPFLFFFAAVWCCHNSSSGGGGGARTCARL